VEGDRKIGGRSVLPMLLASSSSSCYYLLATRQQSTAAFHPSHPPGMHSFDPNHSPLHGRTAPPLGGIISSGSSLVRWTASNKPTNTDTEACWCAGSEPFSFPPPSLQSNHPSFPLLSQPQLNQSDRRLRKLYFLPSPAKTHSSSFSSPFPALHHLFVMDDMWSE